MNSSYPVYELSQIIRSEDGLKPIKQEILVSKYENFQTNANLNINNPNYDPETDRKEDFFHRMKLFLVQTIQNIRIDANFKENLSCLTLVLFTNKKEVRFFREVCSSQRNLRDFLKTLQEYMKNPGTERFFFMFLKLSSGFALSFSNFTGSVSMAENASMDEENLRTIVSDAVYAIPSDRTKSPFTLNQMFSPLQDELQSSIFQESFKKICSVLESLNKIDLEDFDEKSFKQIRNQMDEIFAECSALGLPRLNSGEEDSFKNNIKPAKKTLETAKKELNLLKNMILTLAQFHYTSPQHYPASLVPNSPAVPAPIVMSPKNKNFSFVHIGLKAMSAPGLSSYNQAPNSPSSSAAAASPLKESVISGNFFIFDIIVLCYINTKLEILKPKEREIKEYFSVKQNWCQFLTLTKFELKRRQIIGKRVNNLINELDKSLSEIENEEAQNFNVLEEIFAKKHFPPVLKPRFFGSERLHLWLQHCNKYYRQDENPQEGALQVEEQEKKELLERFLAEEQLLESISLENEQTIEQKKKFFFDLYSEVEKLSRNQKLLSFLSKLSIENSDDFQKQLKEKENIEEEKEKILKEKEHMDEVLKEKQKIDEEKAEILKEKQKIVEENAKILKEKQKMDDENAQILKEKQKIDDENAKILKEKQKTDDENAKILKERQEIDEENSQILKERQKMDEENAKILKESQKIEMENAKILKEKQEMVEENAKILKSKEIFEAEKKLFEENKKNELEKLKIDTESKHSEQEKAKTAFDTEMNSKLVELSSKQEQLKKLEEELSTEQRALQIKTNQIMTREFDISKDKESLKKKEQEILEEKQKLEIIKQEIEAEKETMTLNDKKERDNVRKEMDDVLKSKAEVTNEKLLLNLEKQEFENKKTSEIQKFEDELTNKLQELETQTLNLEKRDNELKQLQESLDKRKQTLQSEKLELDAAIAENQSNSEEKDEVIKKLESEIEALKFDHVDLEKQKINLLNNQFDEFFQRNKQLTDENERLKVEKSSLTKAKQSLLKEQAELKTELDECHKTIASCKHDNEKDSQTKEKLQLMCNDLQKEIGARNLKILQLEKQNELFNSSKKLYDDRYITMKNQVIHFTASCAEKETSCKELQREKESLQQLVKSLKNELASQNEDITPLLMNYSGKISFLENELSNKSKREEELLGMITSYELKLSEYDNKIQNLKNELDALYKLKHIN